ncbi:hypothetical protein IF2G_11038 [Cordyceps javanica]|nr:hypothetical protein IF2G_11038 [Cordyceps javanica]
MLEGAASPIRLFRVLLCVKARRTKAFITFRGNEQHVGLSEQLSSRTRLLEAQGRHQEPHTKNHTATAASRNRVLLRKFDMVFATELTMPYHIFGYSLLLRRLRFRGIEGPGGLSPQETSQLKYYRRVRDNT